ncbi:phosphotransferase family protein [Kineococcus rubinsiae]|uniref:phosphotransferase family protein n=1 Tax=Kineococcus rubinsiae TaxID=2609562 RepID=UPI001430E610|nr:phosphotransferase family protein [Kineococcus rubinsiae]
MPPDDAPLDAATRAWLEGPGAMGRPVAHVEVMTGGYSRETLAVTADDGRRCVLRRFTGTNTCAVEVALLRRVEGLVPVAPVVAADPDGTLSGSPALLSELVPGRDLGAALPTLDPAAAEACGRDVGAALARLGSVELGRPGFLTGPDLVPGPPGVDPTSSLDVFVDRCLAGSAPAREALGPAGVDGLRRLAGRLTPELGVLAGARRLVHGDLNPKNLLVAEEDGRWRLAAVLDWEFAFSSSPLFDVGNLLRRPRAPGFEAGFLAGFSAGGGDLPPGWRRLSTGLDLFSIADLLTRPPGHRYFAQAVAVVRELLDGDGPGGLS